MIERQVAVGSG